MISLEGLFLAKRELKNIQKEGEMYKKLNEGYNNHKCKLHELEKGYHHD